MTPRTCSYFFSFLFILFFFLSHFFPSEIVIQEVFIVLERGCGLSALGIGFLGSPVKQRLIPLQLLACTLLFTGLHTIEVTTVQEMALK